MSALFFDARIDGTQLQKDIANINKQIGQISNNMQKEGQQIDAITGRIGRGLAGAFSIFAAGNFVKDIAKVRGEFQQLEVAFETMLGSREQADKLMADVVQFAARTPFELQDVASGTKQLLAFGVEAEKVIPTLKAVGDVSAGLSVPIERLIVNFGQVKTQMKLTGRELRDFQMAGVPLVSELAKNLNVSEKAISDMVSAGKIGFKDVEEAFLSMTNEGGRFSDLMEKQAKTITGLASNFADAWDRMLNSIGKENEGIIAGSIKGAITLVENYEEILKILKLLIATYGTYRAALIATAVTQRAAVAAGNIKAWFELARGIRSAKDAQLALNVATKANPYALIAGAIASLIAYLVIFRKETKTTQDFIEDLNSSIESIGRQIEVDTLISRYFDLQDKTEKTKDEQNELNKTVAELGRIFPGVIAETDNYGKAINLARERMIELNGELRENTRLSTEKEVADAQDLLNQKIAERARLLKEANQGYVETFVEYSQGVRTPLAVELVPKAIEERRKSIEALNIEINNLSNSIGESEQKLQQLGQIDAAQALAPYRDLFGEVQSYSEKQALKIKEELTKLLFLGFGSEAEKQIKAEIDKIASQLALPTIQEQIKEVLSDLKTAQSQLEGLRAPGSRATTEQISDKQDEIKALQEKYDALTGVNRKEREKQLQEEEKARKERIKAIIEYKRQELDLERQLQASKIALMQQGADRRKAEAELQYQQELDRIKAQQQAYLEAWNASQGFEPGDAGFISELDESSLQRFTQLRVDAEQRKNQQIEQINKDTANEIKNIWTEVNDVFLSESERAIATINQRYDDLIERAKRAGQTDFSAINNARDMAIEQATIDAGMRRLQFEEEIEMQLAEISTQGFNREIEIERKKLGIVKKFAQQKIDLLKKSGDEKNQQEIELLELYIQSADIGLKELNKKTLSDSISKVSELADGFKSISDSIFGIDSQFSNVIGGISSVTKLFTSAASGDFVGAFVNGAKLLMDVVGALQQDNSAEQTQINLDRINKSIQRTNQLIDYQLSLLSDTGGADWFEAAQKQSYILNRELDSTVKKLQAIDVYRKGQAREGAIDTSAWNPEDWLKAIESGIYSFNGMDEAVSGYLNKWIGLTEQISNIETEEMFRRLGFTSEDVSNVIIDGFKNGYDSAADFAKDFEGLMRDAMIKALATQYLEGPMKVWQGHFANFMEDGIIDPEERKKLQEGFYDSAGNWVDGWNQMIAKIDNAAEIVKDTTGIDLFKGAETKPEGLTGVIKGITEETAGLIAGQFTAMREIGQKSYLTGLEQLDSINQSVEHLARIDENTRHNVKLNSIDERLAEMNNYLKEAI